MIFYEGLIREEYLKAIHKFGLDGIDIVEGVYEMGSIVKPLTMAAGLDSGTVSAGTTYNDEGFLVLNGKRISNYDNRGRGKVLYAPSLTARPLAPLPQ